MPRYQFLNIETLHLIIADANERLGSSGSTRRLLSMQPEMLNRPVRSLSKIGHTRFCHF